MTDIYLYTPDYTEPRKIILNQISRPKFWSNFCEDFTIHYTNIDNPNKPLTGHQYIDGSVNNKIFMLINGKKFYLHNDDEVKILRNYLETIIALENL